MDTFAEIRELVENCHYTFCLENSKQGKQFLQALFEVTTIDPLNIQLCCPDWFWQRQVNSYTLQVEPVRFKDQDKAELDYREALSVERIRGVFFNNLIELLQKKY